MRQVVACVGEPLAVLTPPVGSTLEDAASFVVGVAGAELNVAIHLARLGVPARFVGAVGEDPFGRRIVATLRAEGVDVSAVAVRPVRPTGFYFKEHQRAPRAVYYYRRGSATAMFPPGPAAVFATDVAHVHLSGITVALSDPAREAVGALLARRAADRAAGQPHPTVSFDVNFRAALWAAEAAGPALVAAAERADLVFVGLDEARAVWGCATAADVRRLLPRVPELVVKDSERPVTIFTADAAPVQVAPEAVRVIEPVGAGDAFAAGYLAARRAGACPAAAARAGHGLAAHVMGSIGDQGERDAQAYRAIAALV